MPLIFNAIVAFLFFSTVSSLCDEDQLFIKTEAVKIDYADICGRKPLYYCK